MPYQGEHQTHAKQSMRHHVCSCVISCITSFESNIAIFMSRDGSSFGVKDYVSINITLKLWSCS